MGEPVRSPVKGWLWMAAFFGLGVAIGVGVALPTIDKGAPLAVAIFYGAYAGGCGAWGAFFFGLRFWRWVKRAQMPQFSLKRLLASGTLICVGFGIADAAFCQLCDRSARIGDASGFCLILIGCLLIGAGGVLPFAARRVKQ